MFPNACCELDYQTSEQLAIAVILSAQTTDKLVNTVTPKIYEKFKTMEQLENWIMNMVRSVNEVMLKDNMPKKKDVIAEAKEYIRQNYNQNISLNDISGKFYSE